MGVALIGLGVSLWRTQTRTATTTAPTARVEPSLAR
jgi:hypothetical protein